MRGALFGIADLEGPHDPVQACQLGILAVVHHVIVAAKVPGEGAGLRRWPDSQRPGHPIGSSTPTSGRHPQRVLPRRQTCTDSVSGKHSAGQLPAGPAPLTEPVFTDELPTDVQGAQLVVDPTGCPTVSPYTFTLTRPELDRRTAARCRPTRT